MDLRTLILVFYFWSPISACYRGLDRGFLEPFESFDPFAAPIDQSLYPIIDEAPTVIQEPPQQALPFSVDANNVCGDLPKICTSNGCRRRVLCSRRCQRIQDDCTNPALSGLATGVNGIGISADGVPPSILFETEEYKQTVNPLNDIPQEVHDLLATQINFGQHPRIQYRIPESSVPHNIPEAVDSIETSDNDEYYWLTKETFEKQAGRGSSEVADNQRSSIEINRDTPKTAEVFRAQEIYGQPEKYEESEDEPRAEAEIQMSYPSRSDSDEGDMSSEKRADTDLDNAIKAFEAKRLVDLTNANDYDSEESHPIQLGPEDLASILESIGASIDSIPEYNLVKIHHKTYKS